MGRGKCNIKRAIRLKKINNNNKFQQKLFLGKNQTLMTE